MSSAADRLQLRLGGMDAAERLDLGGGLQVAFAEDRTVPLLHCQWILGGGACQDPAGLEGLNSLAVPLLAAAPGARTGGKAEGLETLGADLLLHTDWDHATVAVELAAEDWRSAVEWGEALFSPRLPAPAAVAAERGRRIARQAHAGRSPAALADRWWHRLAYPHCRFGHPLDGNAASLARIGHEDVAALCERLRRLPLWFLAVGCIDRQQLLVRLAEGFQPMSGKAQAAPPRELPIESPAGTHELQLAVARHAEIRVGQASVHRTHADFPGLQLLTAVLSARLASSLRDRSGTSYHCSVRLTPRTGSSPFVIATKVEPARAGETLERIAIELERLRGEPVPAAELRAAQEVFEIDFLSAHQSLSGLVARLKRWVINDHRPNYYRDHLEAVRALRAVDLQDLAHRHFARERLLELVAGPPASLSPWRTAVVPIGSGEGEDRGSLE